MKGITGIFLCALMLTSCQNDGSKKDTTENIDLLRKEKVTELADYSSIIYQKYTAQLREIFSEWKSNFNSKPNAKKLSQEYVLRKGGAITRSTGNYSNFYLRKGVKLSSTILAGINLSEKLDAIWIKSSENLPQRTWNYFIHAESGFFRIYPWNGILSVVGNNMDFRMVPSYKLVSRENDDAGKVKCLPPAKDYGGLGVVAGCSIRVIQGSKFLGVLSIDIPISKLLQTRINKSAIPSKTFEALVYTDGTVILNNKILQNSSVYLNEILENSTVKKILEGKGIDGAAIEKILINNKFSVMIKKVTKTNWFVLSSTY